MSRYLQVLERAERENELLPPVGVPAAQPANGNRPRSLDGLMRDEITKLVQRVFLPPNESAAPRAVAFCGLEHSEASTRICARAGRALSRQGASTVCLVDANLRTPSLHTHFGVENRRGLVDALFQASPICDLAQSLPGTNIWIVPGGMPTADVYTRLSGDLMQSCLAELRTRFSYVLVDTPPADLYADAGVVGRLVDGLILVVEANSTRRETTQQAKAGLDAANVRILGAVLDKRTFPIPEIFYRRL